MSAIFSFSPCVGAGLLSAAVLVGGCANMAEPIASPVIQASAVPEPELPEYIPVLRYDRYTLVELTPLAGQRDLLLQVVDVNMPEDARASVGDGLRHVLKRSGYRLSHGSSDTPALYALPLPAAHLRLGPMTLRDALLTLAGTDWELQIDERKREIRFVQPDVDGEEQEQLIETLTSEAVQTFPVDVTGVQP